MLQRLRELELKLNKTVMRADMSNGQMCSFQEFLASERRRNAWIQELRAKLNEGGGEYPSFEPPADLKLTESEKNLSIRRAWVKSVHDQMDLFYHDARMSFPSFEPPESIRPPPADEFGRDATADELIQYYNDGMPWPGDWVFDAVQHRVFGSPKESEIDFRVKIWGGRHYVRQNYLRETASSLWLVQDCIKNGTNAVVSTDVIDFNCSYSEAALSYCILFVNVRPCIQRKGLITIYLFVTMEACIRSGRYRLSVSKALPVTQRFFAKYGFKVIDNADPSRVDMQIDGEDTMKRALQALRDTHAIRESLGNLYDLDRRINAIRKTDPAESCLDCQTPECRKLMYLREDYFRRAEYESKETAYYLVPTKFPTAEQLADPVYVNSQFPKPRDPMQ